MCIVPKLAYMLQTTKVSQTSLDDVHQPLVRLIKNKLGFPSTLPNCMIAHAGLGRCKLLSQEIFSRQLTSLQHRLNSTSQVGKLTNIRVKQAYAIAGLTKDCWHESLTSSLRGIWKYNLAGLVLTKARELRIEIRSRDRIWQIQGSGLLIQEILSEK